jgi:hypothetical protein
MVAPSPDAMVPGVVLQNPAGADFAAIDSAGGLTPAQEPLGGASDASDAAPVPSVGTATQPVPYPMVPRMAAERRKPAPKDATTTAPASPATPSGDVGL